MSFAALAAGRLAAGTDDFFDQLGETLTFKSERVPFRARMSGTLELEGYRLPKPAPALIETRDNHLITPRLTVFLDADLGGKVYFFAQARADRGFDPRDKNAELRFDEYAVRFMPWRDGRLNLQFGKFATIVGNWVPRHGSWANPFISAPLPYENLTGIWDSAAARTAFTLLEWAHLPPANRDMIADKRLQIPIVWGPSYTTGFSVSGRAHSFYYAAELKHAAISSRPETWDAREVNGRHPFWSGRVGFRPNAMWDLGASAGSGPYLLPSAGPSLVPGFGLGDYRQTFVAHDVVFAWRHWQAWAEVFASRFVIPKVGEADTLAYYFEGKYKFTPQLAGAVRWNEQRYGRIPFQNRRVTWGRDTWRIDAAVTHRFTAHTQLKFQYSFQRGDTPARSDEHVLAGQFTLRF